MDYILPHFNQFVYSVWKYWFKENLWEFSKLFDEIGKFISIIGHYQDISIFSEFIEFKFKFHKMLTSMGFGCRHCRNTTTTCKEGQNSPKARSRWDSYLCSNTCFQKETYHQKNLSWLSMFVACVHHFRDLIEVCRSMHILSKEICFCMYDQMHTS